MADDHLPAARAIRIVEPDYRAFCDICASEGLVYVFGLGQNGRMDIAVCQDCARYMADFNSEENRKLRDSLPSGEL